MGKVPTIPNLEFSSLSPAGIRETARWDERLREGAAGRGGLKSAMDTYAQRRLQRSVCGLGRVEEMWEVQREGRGGRGSQWSSLARSEVKDDQNVKNTLPM